MYLTTQKRVIATSFALISQWSEPLTASPVGEANANKNACAGFKPAQAFLLSEDLFRRIRQHLRHFCLGKLAQRQHQLSQHFLRQTC